MAQIVGRPQVILHATLELTEPELRALDALVGYGDDDFLKVFYERLGEAYMKQHEAGLRLLFNTARQQLPALLARADDARAAFNPAKPVKGIDTRA